MAYAFATLLTSDSYLPGALTLVAAIRDIHKDEPNPQFKTVCIITPETVSAATRKAVMNAFDIVVGVDIIREASSKRGLELLGRPDLHLVLTKLHVFRLVQFDRVIFLDADILPIRPLSHLFSLPHEFSAVPDVGWPDIFNSGFMVLKPGQDKFDDIMDLVRSRGSWDGGDQGVLNEWTRGNWNRLSFTYNTTPTAAYTYAPAYERFGSEIRAIHFIGDNKPWKSLAWRAPGSGSSAPSTSTTRQPGDTSPPYVVQPSYGYSTLVDRWFDVYDRHYRPSAPSEAQLKEIRGRQAFQVPKYASAWDEGKDSQVGKGHDRMGSSGGGSTMGLEQLRVIGAGGWNALFGSSSGGPPPPPPPPGPGSSAPPLLLTASAGLPDMGIGYVGPAASDHSRGGAEYVSMPLPPQPSANEDSDDSIFVYHAEPSSWRPNDTHDRFVEPQEWAPPATATSAPPEHLFRPKPSYPISPPPQPEWQQSDQDSGWHAQQHHGHHRGHSKHHSGSPPGHVHQHSGSPSTHQGGGSPPQARNGGQSPVHHHHHHHRHHHGQHDQSHEHGPHDHGHGQHSHSHGFGRRDYGQGQPDSDEDRSPTPRAVRSFDGTQYVQKPPSPIPQPYVQPPSPPRPRSPPLVTWNPATEPPPDTLPPSALEQGAMSYTQNVWDRPRHQHHQQPPQQDQSHQFPHQDYDKKHYPQGYSTSDHSPARQEPSPGDFFKPPPPSAIPSHLIKEGHYYAVMNPVKQEENVAPVFPWEGKARRAPGRVFPDSVVKVASAVGATELGAAASDPKYKAHPKLSIVTGSTSPPPATVVPSKQIVSPRPKSPPPPKHVARKFTHDWRAEQGLGPSTEFAGGSGGYGNAWDHVPSIKRYASHLVRPSSALGGGSPPPPTEPTVPDPAEKEWAEKIEESDAVEHEADDEDDESDLEGRTVSPPKRPGSSSRRPSSGRRSPPTRPGMGRRGSTSNKVERGVNTEASSWTAAANPGTLKYRSQSVQTIPKQTRNQGVQVNRPPYTRKWRNEESSASPAERRIPLPPVPGDAQTSPVEAKSSQLRPKTSQNVVFAPTPPIITHPAVASSPPSPPGPGRGALSPRMQDSIYSMMSMNEPLHAGIAPSPSILTPALDAYNAPIGRSNRDSTYSTVSNRTSMYTDQTLSTPRSPLLLPNTPLSPDINPHIRTSSNETGLTGPSAASPPSSVGPASPDDETPVPKPKRVPIGRQWDPARNVDIFQKQSQDVLAKFLKMGSWGGGGGDGQGSTVP